MVWSAFFFFKAMDPASFHTANHVAPAFCNIL